MNKKQIIMMGDTHRLISMENLVTSAGLEDCIIIHVGDIGVFDSFHKNFNKVLHNVDVKFKEKNIMFYGVRGNHDDPKYFTQEYFDKFSNFKLVPDYTVMDIQDEKFLFVGGAISVNRRDLIPGLSWWEGEEFAYRPELAEKCDVLISHTTHAGIGPVGKDRIEAFLGKDKTLWSELCKERQQFDALFNKVEPRKHYCGHFHVSDFVRYRNCDCRILDVNEMRSYPQSYK